MNQKGRKILITILTMISIGCAIYLIWYFVGAKQSQDTYEELKEEAVHEETEPEALEEAEEEVEIPIDFEKLWEQNEDIYAWIQIPGTHVDFPVLQHPTDDEFYLNYNIDKKWDAAVGTIFSQASYNKKDFSDFNTILYGHRMGEENPLMFYDLRLYWDSDFMDEHRDVYIYTPTNIYHYKIFAAVVSDNRHHMLYYNEFQEKEDKQAFLDYLWNTRDMRNQYRDDVEVTTDDRILTMSTCIRWEKTNRLLVGAVLVDEK